MRMALSVIEKIDRFSADTDLLHSVVHGPATGPGSTVPTDGGGVPTAASAIAAVKATSDMAIASIQAITASMGYKPPVAYEAGITIDAAELTVEYSGAVYAPLLAAIPFSTSGTFEVAKFRLIQGVASADLAGRAGASMVGFTQGGAGARLRTMSDKLGEIVSVADFGEPDAQGFYPLSALQDGCDYLRDHGGGTLTIPFGCSADVDGGNLTVHPGVEIRGPRRAIGSPGSNTAAPYLSLGGSLRIASDCKVLIGSTGGVTGLLYYRKGMNFPEKDASAFAGMPIVAAGDDVYLLDSMALGFDTAFSSSGFQRPRIEGLAFDCLNGIDISNCMDVARTYHCHGWPYVTIAYAGEKPDNWAYRSGIGFHYHDVCDWADGMNCFAYGWRVAHRVYNADHVILTNPKADNTYSASTGTGYPGTRGIVIEGASRDTQILIPHIEAHDLASIHVNTSNGMLTVIDGGSLLSSGGTGAGIQIDGGDVQIGAALSAHTNGIRVTNPNSNVYIEDNALFDSISQLIVATVDTSRIFIKQPAFGPSIPDGKQIVVGNLKAPTIVASNGGLNLPMNGNFFHVTGTSFGSLNGGHLGREATLKFDVNLTVFSSDGGQSAMHLLSGSHFVNGSVLKLHHDGIQWWEIGRA